ncbi:MAG: DNA adenine methylase [Candidatus Bathyarchaeia archaeon]
MGNLNWCIPKFLRQIPPHETRVEATCGCGELVWYMTPAKVEIMNDLNTETQNIHQLVQRLTKTQYLQLKSMNWMMSKETFDAVKRMVPTNDVETLYRFLYITYGRKKETVVGKNAQFFSIRGGHAKSIRTVAVAHKRLKNITFENLDVNDVLTKYDSQTTYSFIDPPYLAKDCFYNITSFDWVRFCDTLRSLKGKWGLITTIDVDYKTLTQSVNGSYVVSTSKRALTDLMKDYTVQVFSRESSAFTQLNNSKGTRVQKFYLITNYKPNNFGKYFA